MLETLSPGMGSYTTVVVNNSKLPGCRAFIRRQQRLDHVARRVPLLQ
jgi:hypothetical protein